MPVMWIIPSIYQFEVSGPSYAEDMADFGHGVHWPGDLDLSTYKWGHIIYAMGFLPANFQLPIPFRSQLRVRQGVRQTAAINAYYVYSLWERGHHKLDKLSCAPSRADTTQ